MNLEIANCTVMPTEGGKVICFFQYANRFKVRYAALSFSDKAELDECVMWQTSFTPKKLAAAEVAKLSSHP
jgi:hypothetical protein